MRRGRGWAAVLCALALAACGDGEGRKAGQPTAGAGDPGRGRQAYLAYCISCHADDPTRNGPLGPPIKGASRELLEARILRGAYPPGYTPKRDSAVMQPMPQVASQIPDLAAYLR